MERRLEIEELLEHSGWLRQLAARLVRDPGRADDLVQETWVAALRRPPRAGASPRPWLARVFQNLAHNAGRDARTRAEHEQREGGGREPRRPEEIALAIEGQRLVAEAVAALGEPARTLVVLRYFRGLDSAEIGRELGMPAGTVRWRLSRALEELRAELDRRHPGGRAAWAALLTRLLPAPSLVVGPLALVLGAAALLALTTGALLWRRAPTPAATTDAATALAAAAPARGTAAVPALAPTPAERTPFPAAPHAAEPAAPVSRTLAGSVLLGGRVPRASVQLELRLDGLYTEPRFVGTRADGSFLFADLPPQWRGRLSAPGRAFTDGLAWLSVDESTPALELELLDAPLLSGRVLRPDGAGPVPVPLGVQAYNGFCELHGLQGGVETSTLSTVFSTDDEGRFRIALQEGERVRAALHVELFDLGRVVVQVPEFARLEGCDVGDLLLVPGESVPFQVRDPRGQPIAEAFARHEDWPKFAQTDEQGAGTLPCVPFEGAPIRFGARRFHDAVRFVRPGDVLEVVLEPTNVLSVRVESPDGSPLPALRIVLADYERLFLETSSWPNLVPGAKARSRAHAGLPERPVLYQNFDPGSQGELFLRDLAPDRPFTLEVRGLDGRVLATRTLALAAGEWQELVLTLGP